MIYILSESGKTIGVGLFGKEHPDMIIFLEFSLNLSVTFSEGQLKATHPSKFNSEQLQEYICDLVSIMLEHKKTRKTLEEHFDTKIKFNGIKDKYSNDIYYDVLHTSEEEYNQILDVINNHINEVSFYLKHNDKEPPILCIENKESFNEKKKLMEETRKNHNKDFYYNFTQNDVEDK